MAEKITISPTQLNDMGCRFQWYLQYKQGWRPTRKSTALDLGIGVHEALEHYYGPKKVHPVTTFDAWATKKRKEMTSKWEDDVEALNNAIDLGRVMVQGYHDFYDGKDDFEVLATEKTLTQRVPIPGTSRMSRFYLVARLDGIVRDLVTGKLFSLEHKTFERKPSSAYYEIDHQFTAQVWLGQFILDEMGINEKIQGVIYNGLRKQAPGPKVKEPLFMRHKIYRTEQAVQVFLHRAYWQTKEMNTCGIPIYPQPNQIRCGGCGFKEVCVEYTRGGDWRFQLETMCEQKPRKTA